MSGSRLLAALIGGQLDWATQVDGLPVWNPATEKCLGWVPVAEVTTVHRAFATARGAFNDRRWSGLPASTRATVLNQIADALEENQDMLARAETANTGMPLKMTSQGHVPRAIEHFRYFAAECERAAGECFPLDDAYLQFVQREPLGVVAILAPWNAPLAVGSIHLAAALAAGNSVVLKSSERAPLTLALLAEIVYELDLPPGVVNIVHGPAQPTGIAIVESDGVDGLCFIGGTDTARQILAGTRHPFRRCTLELGGNAPTIVCEDADLSIAVEGALLSAFSSNGEVCTAGSRVLVHQNCYDEFLALFTQRARAIQVGDPMEPDTEVGPLIDRAHLERLEAFIDRAIEEGAQLHCGGNRPNGFNAGTYIMPAVLTGVQSNMATFRNEVFGPIAMVVPFRDVDEGVRLANETDYGLSAAIWSRDTSSALALASRLRCGTIGINSPVIRDVRVPFGGRGASGLGRVGGRWSIEQFSEVKTTCIPIRGYNLPSLGRSEKT